MKINQAQHQVIWSLMILGLTFWFGRLSVQYQMHRNLPPMQIVEELNPKVPMIHITEISGAKIIGTVNKSEIRIASGDEVAVPFADLSFELDIQHLGFVGPRRPIIKHKIPEGARFVASKKGKYFYELDEKSAKRLSPANRKYFETEEEARKAGYKKRGID